MTRDANGRQRATALAALTRALFAVLVAAVAQPALAADPPPNIVYIVADDLGWGDVGYHGSDISTPAIDKLATAGARLEQFYAQPMCTPTRAALMTGRYPFRYGLQTLVIPSGYSYGLPLDERLLPQALKDAGYETAIIGKWHLGHGDPKFWPRQRGSTTSTDRSSARSTTSRMSNTTCSTGTGTTSRSERRATPRRYSATML